jgi:hypothetical protein
MKPVYSSHFLSCVDCFEYTIATPSSTLSHCGPLAVVVATACSTVFVKRGPSNSRDYLAYVSVRAGKIGPMGFQIRVSHRDPLPRKKTKCFGLFGRLEIRAGRQWQSANFDVVEMLLKPLTYIVTSPRRFTTTMPWECNFTPSSPTTMVVTSSQVVPMSFEQRWR